MTFFLLPRFNQTALCCCFALFSFSALSNPHSHSPNTTPWISPVLGYFVSHPFKGDDCVSDDPHRGIDIELTKESAVVAPASGLIMVSGMSDPFFPQYKNLIVIDHGNNWVSLYSGIGTHLVKPGEWVNQGQRIAMTQQPDARTKLASLHIELQEQGNAVDPFTKLPYVFFDLQLSAPKH